MLTGPCIHYVFTEPGAKRSAFIYPAKLTPEHQEKLKLAEAAQFLVCGWDHRRNQGRQENKFRELLMITIKMTRLELNALLSLALDRLLEKDNPCNTDTLEWTEEVSDEKVTIDDLVTLLTRGGYR